MVDISLGDATPASGTEYTRCGAQIKKRKYYSRIATRTMLWLFATTLLLWTGVQVAAQSRPTLLVVGVGDSYSSGEGAPDIESLVTVTPPRLRSPPSVSLTRPAEWRAGGFGGPLAIVDWMSASNDRCHRSNKSWQHLVAQKLRDFFNTHPDTSADVMFVPMACTGRHVIHLYNPDRANEDCANDQDPDNQLCAARAISRKVNRSIDVLLVSIGGNDVGFGPAIMHCMASPPGVPCQAAPNIAAMLTEMDEIIGGPPSFPRRFPPPTPRDLRHFLSPIFQQENLAPRGVAYFRYDIPRLEDRVQRLISDIERMNQEELRNQGRLLFSNIFFLEYPSAFRSENGRLCPDISVGRLSLLDALDPLVRLISPVEALWAEDKALPALNKVIEITAEAITPRKFQIDANWNANSGANFYWLDKNYGFFLKGASPRFARQGYCAKPEDRWINNVRDSLMVQMRRETGDVNGAAHPNERGYEEIANGVITEVLSLVDPPAQAEIDTAPGGGTMESPHGGWDINVFSQPKANPPPHPYYQIAWRQTEKDGTVNLSAPRGRNARDQVSLPPRFPAEADYMSDLRPDGTYPLQSWHYAELDRSWHPATPDPNDGGTDIAEDVAIRQCTRGACSDWSAPIRVISSRGLRLPSVSGVVARRVVYGERDSRGGLITSEKVKVRWDRATPQPNGYYKIRVFPNIGLGYPVGIQDMFTKVIGNSEITIDLPFGLRSVSPVSVGVGITRCAHIITSTSGPIGFLDTDLCGPEVVATVD